MALDHFVPQEHLRQFLSPELGHLLHAIDKGTGKRYTPKPSDVCRIEDGNTIHYLDDPRSVEEFLKTVEPKYAHAVGTLRSGQPTPESVYVVSAFAAYIMACSPLATRINTLPAKEHAEQSLVALDGSGEIPAPPKELSEKPLRQLVAEGYLQMHVDPQFPRAMAASSVERVIPLLGNGLWDIVRSSSSVAPFLTSDFPAAIEDRGSGAVIPRVVPLAPDLAVRIIPERGVAPDWTFRGLRFRVINASREQVMAINRSIVRCADRVVMAHAAHDWLSGFVRKHSRYRLDMVATGTSGPSGERRDYRYAVVKSLD